MSDESKVSRQEIAYYLNKEGGASQPPSYSKLLLSIKKVVKKYTKGYTKGSFFFFRKNGTHNDHILVLFFHC